jgi:hypothetical protein
LASGQGPSGPGWLAIALGFWSGRADGRLVLARRGRQGGNSYVFVPPAVGQGNDYFFARKREKKILGVFFARKREKIFFLVFFGCFLGVFVLFGGCFCSFWVFVFVFRALARKNFGFIFRGGPSKAGNFRSGAVVLWCWQTNDYCTPNPRHKPAAQNACTRGRPLPATELAHQQKEARGGEMSAGAPNKQGLAWRLATEKCAVSANEAQHNKPATPRAHSTIHSAAHHCCRVVFENTKRFERVVEHDGSAFRPTR